MCSTCSPSQPPKHRHRAAIVALYTGVGGPLAGGPAMTLQGQVVQATPLILSYSAAATLNRHGNTPPDGVRGRVAVAALYAYDAGATV